MPDETNALPPGQKVATEVAEADFNRFTEAMDFNLDPKGWDDEDKKSFNDNKAIIIRAVEQGRLVFNENGEPVFSPSDGGDSFKFREPRGSDFTATDLKKQGHLIAKTNLMLARMTKQPLERFENMVNRDYKVCGAIISLFLGSR